MRICNLFATDGRNRLTVIASATEFKELLQVVKGAPGLASAESAASISAAVRTEKRPGGATSRWHRFPNGSVNSTAGTLGESVYCSRATHCCPPLRGRSMSRKGVATAAWNSR